MSATPTDTRRCTNDGCGEQMFIQRGAWLCSKCDMVTPPEKTEDLP